MKKKVNAEKNVPNWEPNENDYVLIFVETFDEILGLFEYREAGHNLPKYANMLLCDYLKEMQLEYIPDYTQFMRILHPDYILEYRAYGSRVQINYTKREFFESRY